LPQVIGPLELLPFVPNVEELPPLPLAIPPVPLATVLPDIEEEPPVPVELPFFDPQPPAAAATQSAVIAAKTREGFIVVENTRTQRRAESFDGFRIGTALVGTVLMSATAPHWVCDRLFSETNAGQGHCEERGKPTPVRAFRRRSRRASLSRRRVVE
jgi:hypothetical protein